MATDEKDKRQEVVLDDVAVMYVKSENGVTGPKEAFNALESKIASLRGRKFYGTYDPRTGEYRACVAVQPNDDPSRLGLPTWTIPGGLYVREKMKNWVTRISDIGKTFVMMAERVGNRLDDSLQASSSTGARVNSFSCCPCLRKRSDGQRRRISLSAMCTPASWLEPSLQIDKGRWVLSAAPRLP